MAKRVIQLYDKYKSTTKVYPKVVEESFEPSAKEYIEGQVVANPTLAGTEADLESIQIGGTKYKVGGGSKPIHNITLKSTRGDMISFCIPYEKNTAMTFSEVRDYLKLKFTGIVNGNTFVGLDNYLGASGLYVDGSSNQHQVMGVYYYSREGYVDGIGIIRSNGWANYVSDLADFWNVVNDVIL